MKRTFQERINEFRQHWKNYIAQSLLATFVLFLALFALQWGEDAYRLRNVVLIASIGSTAFVMFAMPNAASAHPRNAIGGQLVGILCGVLGHVVAAQIGSSYEIVAWAAAVGLSMFVMVVSDTEHPPASGTALGVAINGCTLATGGAVIVAVILLSLARKLLRPYLHDLT
jgi:CBS-domain-containing membrane protein